MRENVWDLPTSSSNVRSLIPNVRTVREFTAYTSLLFLLLQVFCSICKSEWHPDGQCRNPFLLRSSPSSSTSSLPGSKKRRRGGGGDAVDAAAAGNNSNNSRSNFFQNFLRRGPAAALEVPAPGASAAGADLDSSPIKRCPICHIPIEREEGCAQMMCKRYGRNACSYRGRAEIRQKPICCCCGCCS